MSSCTKAASLSWNTRSGSTIEKEVAVKLFKNILKETYIGYASQLAVIILLHLSHSNEKFLIYLRNQEKNAAVLPKIKRILEFWNYPFFSNPWVPFIDRVSN